MAAASDPVEVARILVKASVFSSFEPEELAFIARASSLREYGEGEKVFAEGGKATCLFVVASGSVVVSSGAEGPSLLAEFVEGDSFGELEFLTRGVHNATAQAVESATLVTFPRPGQDLETALSERPAMAARILKSFLLVVSRRTRKANALVKENSPWIRELKRQVYGDKLTGLMNKAYLEETLPAQLPPGGRLALIMMKPDNFKEINDVYGHEAGDAALVLMAEAFDRHLGKDIAAVRYMGNELACALSGATDREALETASAVRERLSSLDLTKAIGDQAFRLSVSLGVALYPDHAANADELIKVAAGLPLLGRAKGGGQILFPEKAP